MKQIKKSNQNQALFFNETFTKRSHSPHYFSEGKNKTQTSRLKAIKPYIPTNN